MLGVGGFFGVVGLGWGSKVGGWCLDLYPAPLQLLTISVKCFGFVYELAPFKTLIHFVYQLLI